MVDFYCWELPHAAFSAKVPRKDEGKIVFMRSKEGSRRRFRARERSTALLLSCTTVNCYNGPDDDLYHANEFPEEEHDTTASSFTARRTEL